MELMKASLNGALDLKRMARDGMNRAHEQFENPSKEDIDNVLLERWVPRNPRSYPKM